MTEVLAVEEIKGSDAGLRAALSVGDLPIADLEDSGRVFFRIEGDAGVLGYGGLEVYGPDALLRSVVVPEPLRGKGHGRTVAEAVLREAMERGVKQAYLFTTSAVDFFGHLGFREIERPDAPETILTTRQATKACATAAMLTRTL